VPPRDPERLAEGLRGLLDDPARRAAYGRAGVARARRLYDWDRIAASTLEVYASLAERGHQGRRRGRRGSARRFVRVMGGRDHLEALGRSLDLLHAETDRIEGWGERLAGRLLDGGRLLAVGNGGSAAQAQHLTAELVGRYRDDRPPYSAICLTAETSTLTAIANDYPPAELYARQVEAHGRPGDVLVLMSTSGSSPNIVAAAERGRRCGLQVWALTGPAPNPLAEAAEEALCVDATFTATVQELHLVALHIICAALDRELGVIPSTIDRADAPSGSYA
jgi:phosphoheptose isomerase